uniref:Nuclear receptor domain-containing protein n=1 Tax=Panagrellus redivivus TaxID=6233 RepID=A0A7E4WAD7_PANRE
MTGGLETDETVAKQCSICESPSGASSHFNAIACLACAAFFRRTVSLDITFHCSAQSQCRIFYEQRILCKSCRFTKCLEAGMLRSCVQKRKYNGKQGKSESVEKISEPSSNEQSSIPYSSNGTPPSATHYKPSDFDSFAFDNPSGLLQHFVKEENNATVRRKMMFSKRPISLFSSEAPLSPFIFDDLIPFTVKYHHIHLRFDQLLAFEYTKNLPGYNDLTTNDKITIFRYCCMSFCVLDIAAITCRTELPENHDGFIVYTNATYASIYDLSVGWASEESITSAEKQTLIMPMGRLIYDRMVKPMKDIVFDVIEYAALKALILWRTCYFELSADAKAVAKEHEYYLIKGLHEHYKPRADGPERLGMVILFISNVFELYQNIIENYKKFEIFNLIDLDIFMRELLVQF